MNAAPAPRIEAQPNGHAALWSIFDRFAGDNSPAYRHPSGTLSFAGLHAAVLRLVSEIRNLPRSAKSHPVLIWGHKDPRYPVAYWACLLTGHALVPIEPETPVARLRQIIETCDPCAILIADAQPNLAGRFADLSTPGHLVVVDMPDPTAGGPPHPRLEIACSSISDSEIAYIMFSSGTLGVPKGIKVTYANLIDFIGWLDLLLPDASPGKGVSGTIRHCFDVSLFELWMSWTRKRPLTTLDHADVADSTGYISRLASDRVELWVSTPSIVRLFLKNRRFAAKTLPDLATFVFCGEPLTKAIVADLVERFPGCRIVNTYGPTECTVAVTSVDITPAHLSAPEDLPIGGARPGTRLDYAPGTAPGEAGEIWISGTSVGAGYIGLPEKQAYAFPQPVVYRTGDRGSRDADGMWSFLGRLDREVKIQGFRIDLNDVEAHLRRQPGVEDAVVEPYMLHGEPRALSAFVLGAHSKDCLTRLADSMSADLPPYLVPRYWYAGFQSGLNLNSKLDRSQLATAGATASLRYIHMPGVAGPADVSLSHQEQMQ